MGDVITIGLDIAKASFQAHGADASGAVVFRKKLTRDGCWRSWPRSRDVWWPWKPALAHTIGAVSWLRWVTPCG